MGKFLDSMIRTAGRLTTYQIYAAANDAASHVNGTTLQISDLEDLEKNHNCQILRRRIICKDDALRKQLGRKVNVSIPVKVADRRHKEGYRYDYQLVKFKVRKSRASQFIKWGLVLGFVVIIIVAAILGDSEQTKTNNNVPVADTTQVITNE